MKLRSLIFGLIVVCSPFVAFGQKTDTKPKKIIINGIVTDSIMNPVAGARIFLDNKSTNVVTDIKGFYKVKTHFNTGLISVFTFINGSVEEKEEKIEGRTTINFKLNGIISTQNKNQDAKRTPETVNIGYGSVSREDATSHVNKLDIGGNNNVTYRNIYEMIAGRFAGVQVNGNSIQIQGTSSVNLSTEPLFVVDNMIVSSIDNINPNDVKSIEVLKGSSASIYGSRGATGVIIISLKGSNVKK